MVTSCTVISYFWIEVSGTDPKSIAKSLQEQNMMWKGTRDDSMVKRLSRVIRPAAALGGFLIGVLSVVSDFMGCLTSGTGLLLATTIVYEM